MGNTLTQEKQEDSKEHAPVSQSGIASSLETPVEDTQPIIQKTEIVPSFNEPGSVLIKNIRLVKPDERITSDYLSEYEYCDVVAVRAKHIENGAQIYINLQKQGDNKCYYPNNPRRIAEREIAEKRCPLAIVRYHNDGNTAEYWEVNELGVKSIPSYNS